MDKLDSRSYPAIIIFGIGSVLILIANFVFKDAHVTTVMDAITRMANGESRDMLLLWACALFGVSLQATSTAMMGKLSWESYEDSSYESNLILSIIITIVMALITVISAVQTSFAVMGIIIIVALVGLWAISNNTRK